MEQNNLNNIENTLEIPVVTPGEDDKPVEKTLVPMSKSEFKEEEQDMFLFEEEIPEPVTPAPEESEETETEDEQSAEPRMWVPVLISCVAMIVLCISLITTYIVPVLYQNGFLSGIAKIVSPIIGADLPPQDTNVLIMGVDKDGYRTDIMMIARYNDTEKAVTVLQIPRDTYVGNNGRNDKKINSAYFSGIDQLKKEIKLVCGIDIHKYVTIDLEGFVQVVDLLGGVEVDVPIYMDYDDPEQNLHIHLKPGRQVLDGKAAEGFVRYRKSNDGVDYDRSKSQKEFLSALLKKVATSEGIAKAPELISIAGKYVETNLTYSEIMGYGTSMLEVPEENIVFIDTPGSSRVLPAGYYFFVDKSAALTIAQQYFGTNGDAQLTEDKIPAATPKPSTTEKPEENEPVPTEEPSETDKPSPESDPTEIPSETKKPSVTPAPTPTTTSKPTSSPTVTPKPTSSPTVTLKPTSSPTVTPKPTRTPKHTSAPI